MNTHLEASWSVLLQGFGRARTWTLIESVPREDAVSIEDVGTAWNLRGGGKTTLCVKFNLVQEVVSLTRPIEEIRNVFHLLY